MARPKRVTVAHLRPHLLSARHPLAAREMADRLRVDRTTVVRTLSGFGDELVTLGAPRLARYALRRAIANAGSEWSLYCFDEEGKARRRATVEALYERQWRVTWESAAPAWAELFAGRDGVWDGFPFFLAEVRPQGFMGRLIGREVAPLLGIPSDPGRWSDEHTLLYLVRYGVDLPGNLVLGEEAMRQALARGGEEGEEVAWAESERPRRYPESAQAAMMQPAGSSAGGEQPKFLSMLRRATGDIEAVLVKFTPRLDQPAARRWADLLLAEAMAHAVLTDAGATSGHGQLLEAGERRFWEMTRFDRVGRRGRRGMVSLGGLVPESLGAGSGAWLSGARTLHHQGLIESAAWRSIRQFHAFGELIGNTDMHAGNLAFWLDDTLPFRLTPIFDMLPMLWAPTPQGEVVPRHFAPAPPLPEHRDDWCEAAGWAEDFWLRMVEETRLTPDFRSLAQEALATVRQRRAQEN